MEIMFMVFMSLVSVMSLFSVLVVLRDIVKEILAARREKSSNAASLIKEMERIIAKANAAEEKAAEPAPEAPVEQPVPEVAVAVEPEVEVAAAAEPAEAESEAEEPAEEEAEGTISFSTTQRQTLEEKYLALSAQQRGWYDEIIKYAAMVEGSKRFKNVRYEEYKVGKNRLVRMLIKRNTVVCEFILHNSDFKNYISENKISVKQSATTMLVDSDATVEAVKNSIDIVVASIAEEKEHKKMLARERRKAARAAQNADEA